MSIAPATPWSSDAPDATDTAPELPRAALPDTKLTWPLDALSADASALPSVAVPLPRTDPAPDRIANAPPTSPDGALPPKIDTSPPAPLRCNEESPPRRMRWPPSPAPLLPAAKSASPPPSMPVAPTSASLPPVAPLSPKDSSRDPELPAADPPGRRTTSPLSAPSPATVPVAMLAVPLFASPAAALAV